VALAISENHLKQFPERARVVFLATKVDVYEQQYKLFKEHFSSKDPNIRHDLTHAHAHTHTRTHRHRHTHTQTHINTHTDTYKHTQTHINTHTH